MGRDLTCKELVELVTGYLEGTPARPAAAPVRVPPRRLRRVHALPGADGGDDPGDRARSPRSRSPEEQKAVLLAAFRGWKAS